MTQVSHNFNGGTDGVTIASGVASNSDQVGNNYFDQVDRGTGAIVAYEASPVYEGALAARLAVRATSGDAAIRWSTSRGDLTDDYCRFFIRMGALPGTTNKFVHWFSSALGEMGGIALGLDGALWLLDQTNTLNATFKSSVLSAGQWYRIECFHHASTTAGSLTVRVFNDPTSATPSETITRGSMTLAAATTRHFILGAFSVTNYPSATEFVHLDAIVDGASTWVGPLSSAQTLRPSADSVDGAWTNQAGTSASLFSSISESIVDDTNYIQSEAAPVNSAVRLKLASGSTPGAGTRTFRWRIGKDQTGGGTIGMTAKIYQGGGDVLGAGTLINTFTRSGVDAVTTFDETITGTITDYTALYVEFSANQT